MIINSRWGACTFEGGLCFTFGLLKQWEATVQRKPLIGKIQCISLKLIYSVFVYDCVCIYVCVDVCVYVNFVYI